MDLEMYAITVDSLNDSLSHHGVKGMKWGVRRYQKKDGTLTPAGKKRLVKNITSTKTSTIGGMESAYKATKEIGQFNAYKLSDRYKNVSHLKEDYQDYKKTYHKNRDGVWRNTLRDVEKKYGKYADLERNGEKETMRKFDDLYQKTLDAQFKKHGIYDQEKTLATKLKVYKDAYNQFEKETRKYVEDCLGKYGTTELRGQGSVIRKGGKIIGRITANDVLTDSLMYDLNFDHHSGIEKLNRNKE